MSDIVERLRHWMPIDLEDARRMRNAAADRIEALEAALRAVIDDIHEYERINQLAPSPGRTECWQTVAHAMALLAPALTLGVTPVYATDLEAKMDAEIRQLRRKLAALRVIAMEMPSDSADKLRRIARAALAPEQNK